MKPKPKKIKLKVTEPKEVELEITFPYFTKSYKSYCKFLSMSEAIWVVDYSFKKQIEFTSCAVPESWLINNPITEEEFNAKFNEVMNALIDFKGDMLLDSELDEVIRLAKRI